MKGKTIGEKISVFFSFVIVGLLLYVGTAWGINMLVGPTFRAGEGLIRRGSGDGIDSVHVLPDYTMRINNDSTGIDTTHLWLLADVHYADWGDIHDTLWAHLDDTSAVLWTAIHDTAWMLRDAIHDSIYANTAGYLTEVGTGDITDQTIVKADIDTTSGFVFGSAYLITSAEADSQFMTKAYIDGVAGGLVNQSVKGDHVDSTAENFVFNDAFRITSAEAESIFVTKNHVEKTAHDSIAANGQGFATNSEISDSIWKSKPCQYYASPAIFETMVDSIGVYWWLANGSWDKFLRNYNLSSAADDQIDTIVFSLIMPVESPDIDSLTFDMRTCANDADSAGLTVLMFKRTNPLADTTRIYTGTGIATNSVISHQAIAGGSISAISGGNKLVIWMIGKVDVGDTVEYNEPIPWAPQT